MILVDALYINDGGGKILLDYFLSEINKTDLDVYFLLDTRIKGEHPDINPNKVRYLKGSFFKRHIFYLTNKHRFTKVFCLGNLPPSIRLKAKVFTYFHNQLYVNVLKSISLHNRLKIRLKILIINKISNNCDYWLVQTSLNKTSLQLKFQLNSETIKVMPFYPQFPISGSIYTREKNTYLYVSNATPHKNHKRLIEVFCEFYNKHQIGKLILTVNDDYPEILQLVDRKIKNGYPIENIGFVDRLTLQQKYLSCEFLIFPSLTESFGLGLIEAIECGCQVIAADLPYTFEVCEPSYIFNPNDEDSIFRAFEKSFSSKELKPSLPKIENNINQIISLLK